MNRYSTGVVTVALIGSLTGSAIAASAASARPASKWDNCTSYNKFYPHGVGRNHAHDHTSGTPVTNFKHSTRLYKIAMSYNSDLDRDGDGIACEKR